MQQAPVAPRRVEGVVAQGDGHEREAEGPDVADVRVLLAADALRRHVGERADEGVGLGERRVHLPDDAEVRHLDVAEVVDEQVRRLDVAVDLVLVVDEGEPEQHPIGDVGQHGLGPAPARLDDVLQGAAVHVLHGDRDAALVRVGPGVVEGHDVGAEPRRGAAPAGRRALPADRHQVLVERLELPHHLVALVLLEDGDVLDRHDPQGRNVDGLVHDPARAPPQDEELDEVALHVEAVLLGRLQPLVSALGRVRDTRLTDLEPVHVKGAALAHVVRPAERPVHVQLQALRGRRADVHLLAVRVAGRDLVAVVHLDSQPGPLPHGRRLGAPR